MGHPGSADLAEEAVRHLAALAHPGGGWTDFWVAAGPSSSWVTAYAGVALAQAGTSPWLPGELREVGGAAVEGAVAAVRGQSRDGSWGWSASTRPDVDSTAWVIRLLASASAPVPDRAWAFLDAHRTEGGYRTYRDPALGTWTAPSPEVSAIALLAQYEAGRISRADLRGGLERWCAPAADLATPDGGPGDMTDSAPAGWTSLWWPGVAHPTALVSAARAAAGLAMPRAALLDPASLARGGTAGLAAAVWAGAAYGAVDATALGRLWERRHPLGGWAGDTVVLVPPQGGGDPPLETVDARGVFTTATVLHACVALGGLEAVGAGGRPAGRVPRHTAGSGSRPGPLPRDERWDAVVDSVAAAMLAEPGCAGAIFRALTAESLAAPAPWPSAQLSSLAGGQPVEFSASATRGLRLTTDVGDPRLPPAARLASGLAAVGRTAALLGVGSAWAEASGAVGVLADGSLPVPAGCRFWLWAGVDLADDRGPVLKVYLSQHTGDVPGGSGRRDRALVAAGVPAGSPVTEVLSRLDAGGWGHEVGVGLGTDGRWGLKVYSELDRWRPDVLAGVLAAAGLDTEVGELAPTIPGVLRASTEVRRRAGIALRVDRSTGEVTEVTTAAAFPAPLVGRRELLDRVLTWQASRGEPTDALERLTGALADGWRSAPPLARMLSLFTRTAARGRPGTTTTVYVRPWVGGSPSVSR